MDFGVYHHLANDYYDRIFNLAVEDVGLDICGAILVYFNTNISSNLSLGIKL